MPEGRAILASDLHLSPARPEEMEIFVRFTREVVAGAARFFVLGDLFNFWVGPANLRVPGFAPVFDALSALSAGGTEVTLLHGNRDFLLDEEVARRIGGRVAGEETAVELHGRRYLLLHGDSLCTADVGYQRSKVRMRSRPVRWLARVLPLPLALRIVRRMRRASRESVAQKTAQEMGIVAEAVRARFREGYAALVCGHVHDPGVREFGGDGESLPLFVLGAWRQGGVYAVVDAAGVRLERFPPAPRGKGPAT
ncbi:MAG: UDP-2,3-diacylglucosamine diphosphatase [Planctomycetes bacterium]|nr:UDP-2,3-diacylglucosamine diphosphatase [Planctomycetota bacterium]